MLLGVIDTSSLTAIALFALLIWSIVLYRMLRMKVKVRLIHAGIVILGMSFLASCKKTSSSDNGTNAPQDTLTAGWTMTKINTEQFTNIHFVQSNGIAVSTTGIYGSDNGGLTWQQRSDYGNGAFAIGYAWKRNIGMDGVGNVIVPQGYGNIDASQAKLALAHDYKNFTIVNDNVHINDIRFVTNNVGYAITSNDQDTTIHFLKTVDGGTSWIDVSTIPRMPIITNVAVTRLAFVSSQTGWASTPYGLFKTTNGGSSWSFQYAPAGIIANICAVDENICYAGFLNYQGANDVYTIIKTAVGGTTWQQVFSAINDYEAFWFVTADTGYKVVGRWIYKSTDGGVSWNKEIAIHSSQCGFTDIYFTDPNHGWACSGEGQILRYVK
jgi:photosystem II stability/assembly factor-like uncharacterized protein